MVKLAGVYEAIVTILFFVGIYVLIYILILIEWIFFDDE